MVDEGPPGYFRGASCHTTRGPQLSAAQDIRSPTFRSPQGGPFSRVNPVWNRWEEVSSLAASPVPALSIVLSLFFEAVLTQHLPHFFIPKLILVPPWFSQGVDNLAKPSFNRRGFGGENGFS